MLAEDQLISVVLGDTRLCQSPVFPNAQVLPPSPQGSRHCPLPLALLVAIGSE